MTKSQREHPSPRRQRRKRALLTNQDRHKDNQDTGVVKRCTISRASGAQYQLTYLVHDLGFGRLAIVCHRDPLEAMRARIATTELLSEEQSMRDIHLPNFHNIQLNSRQQSINRPSIKKNTLGI
jgi:hypothetical protein